MDNEDMDSDELTNIFSGDGAEFWGEHLEYDHKEAGNPFYVWEAIRLRVEAGISIPDWTYPYLLEVAKQLIDGERPAKALGMSVGKGKAPRLQEFEKAFDRDTLGYKIDDIVADLRRRHRRGVKDSAYQTAANELGITSKQARTLHEKRIQKTESG